MPKLRALLSRSGSARLAEQLDELERIVVQFKGTDLEDMLRVDFSVANDLNYYNGIVFRGFVEGVPTGVLSGGQYDRLMRKMKHQSGAIGFAIYLDLLERLDHAERAYDVDTLLLYDRRDDPRALRAAAAKLTSGGHSVMAQKELPEGIKFRQLMRLEGNEAKLLEHA